MDRQELSDSIWARKEPHLPGKVTDLGRTGRDNRLFVEAILWLARSGAHWRSVGGYSVALRAAHNLRESVQPVAQACPELVERAGALSGRSEAASRVITIPFDESRHAQLDRDRRRIAGIAGNGVDIGEGAVHVAGLHW